MKRLLALLLALLPLTAHADPRKISIASFGPHPSLTEVIDGFKSALASKGFADGKDITYSYQDCHFDPALVPQVLASAESQRPDLLFTVTTPMTQAAVKLVHNASLPIVFAPVTDPVAAGLVPDWAHGSARFVGASNVQDMTTVIGFAGKLLGPIHSFGMLFNPGDANDVVSKNLAEQAAAAQKVEFHAIGVDAVADIPQRTTLLKGVDFIYVSPSNLIMPALPAVASTADHMNVPLIISSPPGVQDNVALAAMSVSWSKVGYQAGLLAADILNGAKPADLPNYKPTPADHTPLISGKRLKSMNKTLPAALADCKCVIE
jgi:putative ABC transport system substrate-binding protein